VGDFQKRTSGEGVVRMRRRASQGWACALAGIIVLACVLVLSPAHAHADVSVDVTAPSTIVFEDCKAPGQTFTVYQVATMARDGSLAAVDALAPTVRATGLDPANLSAETDAATARTYARSYEGPVMADAASFASAQATEANGTAAITGLAPGAYLVVASTVTTADTVYLADPTLVVVPVAQPDGSAAYTRTVKADKVTQTHARTFDNRVVKLWAGDDASVRPASVTVQIFNGSELYQEVELSADNDWTFAWEGAGDWSVREVLDGTAYTATVAASASDDTQTATFTQVFQVTNQYAPPEVPPSGDTPKPGGTTAPRTGDMLPRALPVVFAVVGIALIAAGVAKRKTRG
jgi:hypothetical protein